MSVPDDLTKLPSLDPDAIEAALKSRYASDKIYSNINTLLVALNPYKAIPGIYSGDTLRAYTQYAAVPEAPHVYAIAGNAYRGLLESNSQSIVISGESGAGKTETSKIILQFLAHAATSSAANSGGLEGRIIASTPVLECFGNARTLMNDNSSRYGKFLMLQFDVSGKIIGASIQSYLLEKSRVVTQASGERNYHSLYYLCAGPQAKKLGLSSNVDDYSLLSKGTGQSSDASMYESTDDALAAAGFTSTERDSTWKMIGALLLLGNISFGAQLDADSEVMQPTELKKVASMLSADEAGLLFALTKRKIRAGRDFIDTPSSVEQAGYMREGMVKAMYSRLFDWLVSRVNESLALGQPTGGGMGGGAARFFVGILDVFGFEMFEHNSLEQLCINFTNEKLQNRFNEAVFASAQEENAVEGVQVEDADLADFDNQEVLDLIESHPHGILAMVNEECIVPQGTDLTLHEKLLKQHISSRRFKKVLKHKDKFEVVHYAGKVIYSSTGMLGKNKDKVSEDMIVLMQASDDLFVRKVFADTEAQAALLARKRGAKFQGVVAKFVRQLDELMRILDSSHMHFIRCVKPNMTKQPDVWDSEVLMRQLRCSGVLEVVRVFGMGYPDRVPHHEILSRFLCVVPLKARPSVNDTEKSQCEALLMALLQPREYAIGRSKAFLKSSVLTKLRVLREEQIALKSSFIQACARGMSQRKKWKKLWQEHLQEKARMEEERVKKEEEETRKREEKIEKERREMEISQMNKVEKAAALAEEEAKEKETQQEVAEANRRQEEEDKHRRDYDERLAEESYEGKKAGGAAAAGDRAGVPGFSLNMSKVTAEAQKAAEDLDKTQQWTPRARPKDAPQQSARYQSEFKALPEDILEYAVYLGMDPTVDQDLLWIAEEALMAPDPPGWTEMLDPRGLLYFYNETSGQSSRQHPLDEHYQNLYLKMKMQKAVTGVTGGGGGSNATLTTDELQQRREQLASEFATANSLGISPELQGTMTSISQALSLSTPRSTQVLHEKFGISKPDTDVRALLINPARWADPTPSMNQTQLTCEGASGLFPRHVLLLCLSENYKAFAFSATKRVNSSRTEFVVSLDQEPEAAAAAGASFAGRLRTNQKSQEWVMHDDSNDPYGIKTGQPRRELGLIVYKKNMLGPILVDLVIPRVRKDGACAQFRPHTPEEAMLQLFKAGRVDHMYVLRGQIVVQPGALIELLHEIPPATAPHAVFRARKHADGTWTMAYMHPLSAFQAFNFLISILHNPLTGALDVAPLMDAEGTTPITSTTPVGEAKSGPEIVAMPGRGLPVILNTATLEGLGDAVYALAVLEHKVFSGLYSGDIQVWHMDHYINLPNGSKPEFNCLKGHTAAVCALLIEGRSLFSASDDKTILVWDLNTLKKKATLKGHTHRVRCLAIYGQTLVSGGNDKKIRVWDLNSYSAVNTIEAAHQNWIRGLAIYEGTHCVSGSRDKTVKVWDMKTWDLIGTFSASSDVYAVAVGGGMVYAACSDFKIRIWNLQTLQKSHMLIGHDGIVRALHLEADKYTLYTAAEDKKVKVWDLKSGECATLFGHTKFIRCVVYESKTKTLYSAGDDAKIKMWEARSK